MEQHTFPYRGKTFKISLGGINVSDILEIVNPLSNNIYKDEILDINKISKRSKEVNVGYREYISDIAGVPLWDKVLEFNAGAQEAFPYFYNMIIGGTATLGNTLDKMIIDGFLIAKYGLPYGVFGNDGKFYQPIWFNYTTKDNLTATTVVNPDGTTTTTNKVTSKDLTITVQDKLINNITNVDGTKSSEVYTYKLLNSTVPTNTTGIFVKLPLGTYSVMVESPNSMPCIQTIVL